MSSDQIDNLLHKIVAMGGAAVAANGGAIPTTGKGAFVQIAGAVVALAAVWLSHRANAAPAAPAK